MLGLIPESRTRMYAAQAAGCSPIVTMIKNDTDVLEPVRPNTIAKSLAIGNPADGYYAYRAVEGLGRLRRGRHRRGDHRGHAAAGPHRGHLRGDGRRRDGGGDPEADRAGPHPARRAASSSASPATGSRRRTRCTTGCPPHVDHPALALGVRPGAGRSQVQTGEPGRRRPSHGRTVRIPTPLRTLTKGAAEVQADGGHRDRPSSRILERQFPGLQASGSSTTAASSAASSTSTSTRRTSASSRARRPRSRRATRSPSSPPSRAAGSADTRRSRAA